MQFRLKPVQGSWIFLPIYGMNGATALLRIFSHRDSRNGYDITFLVLLTIATLLTLFRQQVIFWEMDADSLRYRRLWFYTKIEWQDITSVVSQWSGTFDLKIEYHRRGFGSKIGRILTNPLDRDGFLDALRQYAPQAEFVDESRKSILAA